MPVCALSWEKPVKKDILYCVSLSKSFGRIGIGAYSEFTVDTGPIDLGYNYSNLSINCLIRPWLKTVLAGGYTEEGGVQKWMQSLQLIETFNRGDFTLLFRELVTHYHNPDTGEHSGIVRLRVNASYHIPGTAFSPLIATETYLWDGWRRTSLYAGTRMSLSSDVTLSTYYMASFLNWRNMHHLVLSFAVRL